MPSARRVAHSAAHSILGPLQQRRQRLTLMVCGSFIAGISAAWALLHLGMQNWGMAATMGAFSAAGMVVLEAARRGALGTALGLFCFGAWAMVVGLALTVDIPTANVPRGVHFYLLPLLVAQRFLLQDRPSWMHWSAQAINLGLFGWLHLAGNPLQWVSPMSEPLRFLGLYSTIAITIGLCAVVLHVQTMDWRERTGLALDLARAIAQDALHLDLQAQVDQEDRLTGAEALLCWRPALRTPVQHRELLVLAERHNLTAPLVEWALGAVLALLTRWQADALMGRVSVAVNLGAQQLHDPVARERLLERVRAHAQVAPRLVFELSESAFCDGDAEVKDFLARCTELGVRCALDDFGTGYSSLGQLKKLVFHQLKIDSAFVRSAHADTVAAQVAQSVIDLGQRLGMDVIAEGVESVDDVQVLAGLGCHRFQGKHFALPMPASDFAAWALERVAR